MMIRNFLIAVLLSLFIACNNNPCNDEDIIKSNYPILNKDFTSYHGSDTISLINNGQQIDFYGQGIQKFNVMVTLPNGECKGEEKQIDQETIRFKNYQNFDEISFNYTGEDQVEIKFKNLGFQSLGSWLKKSQIDSITVNNKVYRDVSQILDNPGDSTAYILYNISDGIIKIFIQGNEWNLKK